MQLKRIPRASIASLRPHKSHVRFLAQDQFSSSTATSSSENGFGQSSVKSRSNFAATRQPSPFTRLPCEGDDRPVESVPRWQRTPPRLALPFVITPPSDTLPPYRCNESGAKLDQFYRHLFWGDEKLLAEETRWLAVTHKTFDQGKRGYNDRLSYLGRRIVEAQTSLALVQRHGHGTTRPSSLPKMDTAFTPATTNPVSMMNGPAVADEQDKYERNVPQIPGLDGLAVLGRDSKEHLLRQSVLFGVAQKYELDKFVRWRPMFYHNLKQSGIVMVSVQALYAIVGALALEKGSGHANHFVLERLLASGLREIS